LYWWNFSYCTLYLHFILMKKQRHKELETILVLVLAFVVLYRVNGKPYFFSVSLGLGLLGLFFPAAARFIHFCWMKLAQALGWVTSKITLTLIFIIVVIPMGWIIRRTGKSSISLTPGSKSYYKDRNHLYEPADLENLW